MSLLLDVRDAYKEFLYLRPRDIWAVDFAACLILASKMRRDTEAVFGALVGPPATGKTLILSPYMSWNGMAVSVSDITAHGFQSGSPTVSCSLVNRLDRRALIMKDMTSNMNKDIRDWNRLFGELRGAFDGSNDKYSGALSTARQARVRFSLAGAVTEQIYQYINRDVDMGQRFLFMRLFCNATTRERYNLHLFAIESQQRPDSWKTALKQRVRSLVAQLSKSADKLDAAHEALKAEDEDIESYQQRQALVSEEAHLGWDNRVCPTVQTSEDHIEHIFHLTELATRIRSGKTLSAQGLEDTEGTPRMAKQLHTMGVLRAWLDGRTALNETDSEFIRIIARDTVSPGRLELVRWLYAPHHDPRHRMGLGCGELVQRCHMDSESVQQLLMHWHYQGFVTQNQSASGSLYRLSEEHSQMLAVSRMLESS